MQRLIGGLIICICLFGGFVIIGGNLKLLFKPMEIFIIFGAGIGGLVLGTNKSTLLLMGRQLKMIFSKSIYTPEFYKQLLCLNYELSKLKRSSSGIKVLEEHVEDYENSSIFDKYPLLKKNAILMHFIVDNYRVAISGPIAAHEMDAMLEGEIETIKHELIQPANALKKMAESLPGLGVLGAVMGIILTMKSIDADISLIGVNIATALVGTFIGIFGCYCLCDPLGSAIKNSALESMGPFEVVRQILVSLTANKSPLLCIDSGRRTIEIHGKPSFQEIDLWLAELN